MRKPKPANGPRPGVPKGSGALTPEMDLVVTPKGTPAPELPAGLGPPTPEPGPQGPNVHNVAVGVELFPPEAGRHILYVETVYRRAVWLNRRPVLTGFYARLLAVVWAPFQIFRVYPKPLAAWVRNRRNELIAAESPEKWRVCQQFAPFLLGGVLVFAGLMGALGGKR